MSSTGYTDYYSDPAGTLLAPFASLNFHEEIPNDPGKMFIGGLSWQTTPENVREYFSQFGDVAEVMVMKDPATRRSRGFGFITFTSPSSVDKVLAVASHTLDGKMIEPKVAVPRKSNPKLVMRTKKIFVGGLSATTGLDDIKAYFEQFSAVKESMLAYDKVTNRHRGFGFVTFDNEDVVDKICEIHFHEINGKMVESKKALPKEPRIMGMGGNMVIGPPAYNSAHHHHFNANLYTSPGGPARILEASHSLSDRYQEMQNAAAYLNASWAAGLPPTSAHFNHGYQDGGSKDRDSIRASQHAYHAVKDGHNGFDAKEHDINQNTTAHRYKQMREPATSWLTSNSLDMGNDSNYNNNYNNSGYFSKSGNGRAVANHSAGGRGSRAGVGTFNKTFKENEMWQMLGEDGRGGHRTNYNYEMGRRGNEFRNQYSYNDRNGVIKGDGMDQGLLLTTTKLAKSQQQQQQTMSSDQTSNAKQIRPPSKSLNQDYDVDFPKLGGSPVGTGLSSPDRERKLSGYSSISGGQHRSSISIDEPSLYSEIVT